MPPAFEQRRNDLIARLEALVREDDRLLALWLQGSLADGTSDAWSDVDAYIAVRDDAYDEVFAARTTLTDGLGTLIISMDLPGMSAICCLYDGPAKLDLFFEPASRAAVAVRPAVRVLLDKGDITAALKTGWQPAAKDAFQLVDRLFRGTFQGASWPLRLLERRQWTTFAMTELMLVNDFLVAFMAAQQDTRLLFKNRFTVPRLLPAAKRSLVEDLGIQALQSSTARDLPTMLAVHLRILDALLTEGRAAYTAFEQPYPMTEAAEAALRAFYQREWPTTLTE